MQPILIGLRKANKESQKDLSNILKISEEAYRNKELGRSQFKIEEMFTLAEHYGKSLNEIFLPRKFTFRELEKINTQKGDEKREQLNHQRS